MAPPTTMPELPEVENTVRDLKPQLVGRRVRDVQVLWPRLLHGLSVEDFSKGLIGRQIIHTDRRGKYLLFSLDDGKTLLLHLRMTGQLFFAELSDQPDKHTHLVLELSDGQNLHYRDQRKFGRFYLVEDPRSVVGKLGPEPLQEAFSPMALWQAVLNRRSAIKTLLLDQRVVAGIGNIYADEALFLAGIDPRRPGSSLSLEDCQRLHASIRTVLAQAIREGGSTFNTYARPAGIKGQYQERHRVFRRTGKPCPACGKPIERIRLSQRSTHFCSHCQG